MSLSLSGGPYLKSTAPPFTNYPFQVAAWLQIRTTGTNKEIWSLTDGSATPTNYFSMRVGNTNLLTIVASATGGATTQTSTTLAVGKWYFTLMQFLSATSRRINVVQGSLLSTVGVSNSATSKAPTGLNQEYIGALGAATPANLFNGLIAEFWKCNAVFPPISGTGFADTLRQLALKGPFSVPAVAASLVEYRSFRKGPPSSDEAGEVAFGNQNRQLWTPSGSPSIGASPPLSSEYSGPSLARGFSLI